MADDERAQASIRLRKSIGVVIEDKQGFGRIHGTVADISPTGMRLLSGFYLPPSAQYAFAFKGTSLVVRGEVRWARAFEGDTFACGVFFAEMDDEQRRTLLTFLERKGRRAAAR
jgi:PilZ domain